jgi:hypothetical protein
MTSLPNPLLEARAKAILIETRAQAIAGYARRIFETTDPLALNSEDWMVFINALDQLHKELGEDITSFAHKAKYA